MRCPKCGVDYPDDMKFCTNCGSRLEAAALPTPPTSSTNYCPRCGSQVRPEARFCDQCGQDLTGEVVKETPGVAPPATPAATAAPAVAPEVKPPLPLASIIAAGIGAIMMLVSLAVTWYTPRAEGDSYDLKVSDLLNPGCAGWPGCPTWAGWGLPVVLMIVFASLVLISVVYSFATRSATRSVWSWLGTLCLWCVIGNALYVLYWHYDQSRAWTGEGLWFNIVQVGCVLAFVGALVVIFSGAIGRRRTQG